MYYVPPGRRTHHRHRIDKEIQQLTLKSRGGDNEVRTEINLTWALPAPKLMPEAWMGVIGALPGYGIVKEIRVFDFPDCEVVYYEATQVCVRLLRGIRGEIRGERRGGVGHFAALRGSTWI